MSKFLSKSITNQVIKSTCTKQTYFLTQPRDFVVRRRESMQKIHYSSEKDSLSAKNLRDLLFPKQTRIQIRSEEENGAQWRRRSLNPCSGSIFQFVGIKSRKEAAAANTVFLPYLLCLPLYNFEFIVFTFYVEILSLPCFFSNKYQTCITL